MADDEPTTALSDTLAAEEAARILLDIRRSRSRPRGLPEHLAPHSVEQAYAIQDVVVGRLGGIGGWKIVHPAAGAAPRCSPIPASSIMQSGVTIARETLLWPEVEVELAVMLGQDLPPRAAAYHADDVAGAISFVTGAFELLGSRFADRSAVTRSESLADLLSSAGVVTGNGRASFDAIEFADVSMSLTLDGAVVGTATGGPSSAEVLNTLTWLANHACARSGGLRAGQVVITGARIHPVSLPAQGGPLLATLANIGTVEAYISAAG